MARTLARVLTPDISDFPIGQLICDFYRHPLSFLDSKYQRRKGSVLGVEPDRRVLRCASRRVGAFVPYIYVSHLVVGPANSYAGEPACTFHDVQWQVLDR